MNGLLTWKAVVQASVELSRRRKDLAASLKGKVVEILDDLPGQILQQPLFQCILLVSGSVLRLHMEDLWMTLMTKAMLPFGSQFHACMNPCIDIPCHAAACHLFQFFPLWATAPDKPPLIIYSTWHVMA